MNRQMGICSSALYEDLSVF